MDLLPLLRAAQATNPSVIGLSLRDLNDPDTWEFQRDPIRVVAGKPRTWTPAPALTRAERVPLVAAVRAVLDAPLVEEAPPIDAEAVLAWCAMKFGVDPLDAALEVVSGVVLKEKP